MRPTISRLSAVVVFIVALQFVVFETAMRVWGSSEAAPARACGLLHRRDRRGMALAADKDRTVMADFDGNPAIAERERGIASDAARTASTTNPTGEVAGAAGTMIMATNAATATNRTVRAAIPAC